MDLNDCVGLIFFFVRLLFLVTATLYAITHSVGNTDLDLSDSNESYRPV